MYSIIACNKNIPNQSFLERICSLRLLTPGLQSSAHENVLIFVLLGFWAQDSTLASMLLRPGPLLAIQRAQFSEGGEVDQVKRVYIRTTQDRVIKPEQQEAMIKRWPPSDVFVLESDHSPFFSSPLILFSLLIKAAAASSNCN